MITKQKYTQEEIEQRAKENSKMYHGAKTTTWCNQSIIISNNGSFEFLEPEESYYWTINFLGELKCINMKFIHQL